MGRKTIQHPVDYQWMADKLDCTVHNLRMEANRGKFNPDSLDSMLDYVRGHLALRSAQSFVNQNADHADESVS